MGNFLRRGSHSKVSSGKRNVRLMEKWLERLRQGARHRVIRIIAAVALAFLALAGLVALAGDLGLSEEITAYRVQVWLALFAISVLLVGGYEVTKELRLIAVQKTHIEELETKLADAETRNRSLLRLMESYKRSAYAEILDHLSRLMILAAKREQWSEADAKVKEVHVKAYSDAEDIDPEFAMRDRIEVIIDIGRQQDVVEGMQFIVQNPTIPRVYGVIAVKAVYDQGATCFLSEYSDDGFWAQALNLSAEGKSEVLQMSDNRIVPALPADLDNVSPELAEDFLQLIEKIASAERGKAGS
jgi:hypothetical protein